MKVLFQGKRIELTDADLLGVGGEASVYRWDRYAIKIFHPLEGSLPKAERQRIEAERARKFDKLSLFPSQLPPEVLGPLGIVDGMDKRPAGFAMRALLAAGEVARLTQRRHREGTYGNDRVMRLFKSLRATLEALHARGVVVGDLNDGNVLFSDDTAYLIDADSMQFGAHPCTVGHERYLDPRLYGEDLTARPAFSPESDWYAFAVMLFTVLLFVHPYGGTHPSLKTTLRRAEAGHSVLRQDVVYPKAALSYRSLSDDLYSYFWRTFDEGRRDAFPSGLLATTWNKCACGEVHARSACPACAVSVRAPRLLAVRHHGACRAIRILAAKGRILFASSSSGLAYVVEDGGVVRREDGSRVMDEAPAFGARFLAAGARTWIGLGPDLAAVEREALVGRSSTATFGKEPALAVSGASLYRIEGDWLVEEPSALRIGRVLPGQTWIAAGDGLGFGFYRAGLVTVFFLWRPGRPGFTDVKLPSIDGRIVDLHAAFDDTHVVFSILVEKGGARASHLFLVRQDGRVLGSLRGSPEEHRALRSIRGRAVLGGHIVTATEEGLLSLRADDAGAIHEARLFEDTEPFISAGAEILPGPGGSVYVVTTREITQLVLS